MKTGASIFVSDINNAHVVEFVHLADGLFLTVAHYDPDAPPNGNRMRWQSVLGYLVTVAKATAGNPTGYFWTVRGGASGQGRNARQGPVGVRAGRHPRRHGR